MLTACARWMWSCLPLFAAVFTIDHDRSTPKESSFTVNCATHPVINKQLKRRLHSTAKIITRVTRVCHTCSGRGGGGTSSSTYACSTPKKASTRLESDTNQPLDLGKTKSSSPALVTYPSTRVLSFGGTPPVPLAGVPMWTNRGSVQ